MDLLSSDPMSAPTNDQIRRLLHGLREPVSAFAIHVSLLDDTQLDASARRSVDAMLANVEHMTKAFTAITKAFGLEVDDTPLAMLSENGRGSRIRR
jgi:hypothetical protein